MDENYQINHNLCSLKRAADTFECYPLNGSLNNSQETDLLDITLSPLKSQDFVDEILADQTVSCEQVDPTTASSQGDVLDQKAQRRHSHSAANATQNSKCSAEERHRFISQGNESTVKIDERSLISNNGIVETKSNNCKRGLENLLEAIERMHALNNFDGIVNFSTHVRIIYILNFKVIILRDLLKENRVQFLRCIS